MTTTERTHELLRLVAIPESDYWYDVACIDARTLLDAGGDQLLGELLPLVEGMSPIEQEHLAYILGDSAAVGELVILEMLRESAHAEVAYRAREALRGIPTRKA